MNFRSFLPTVRRTSREWHAFDTQRARRSPRASLAIGLLAMGLSSCVTSNFDFTALDAGPSAARSSALLDGLQAEDDTLTDLTYVPLVHMDYQAFAIEKDESYPDGFLEVDLEAYLPLFALFDSSLTRYDDEGEVYEQHDHKAFLWGLYSSRREQIATEKGVRRCDTGRLLWFIRLGGSPSYTDAFE